METFPSVLTAPESHLGQRCRQGYCTFVDAPRFPGGHRDGGRTQIILSCEHVQFFSTE